MHQTHWIAFELDSPTMNIQIKHTMSHHILCVCEDRGGGRGWILQKGICVQLLRNDCTTVIKFCCCHVARPPLQQPQVHRIMNHRWSYVSVGVTLRWTTKGVTCTGKGGYLPFHHRPSTLMWSHCHLERNTKGKQHTVKAEKQKERLTSLGNKRWGGITCTGFFPYRYRSNTMNSEYRIVIGWKDEHEEEYEWMDMLQQAVIDKGTNQNAFAGALYQTLL